MSIGSSSQENASSLSTSLLQGLKARESDAWGRLSRLYAPLVYYWCLRGGLRRGDAEDVVQEVFLTVAAKVDQFRRDSQGGTFRGWLRAITRNKLGDFYRKHNREHRGPLAPTGGTDAYERLAQIPANAAAPSDEPSASVEMGLLYRQVYELIRSEFEESSWQAFLAVAVGEAKPKDVAADLGISVNAVYLAKSRIMRRVREELGEIAD